MCVTGWNYDGGLNSCDLKVPQKLPCDVLKIHDHIFFVKLSNKIDVSVEKKRLTTISFTIILILSFIYSFSHQCVNRTFIYIALFKIIYFIKKKNRWENRWEISKTHQILYLSILLGGEPCDIVFGLANKFEHLHRSQPKKLVVGDPLSERRCLCSVYRRILTVRWQVLTLADLGLKITMRLRFRNWRSQSASALRMMSMFYPRWIFALRILLLRYRSWWLHCLMMIQSCDRTLTGCRHRGWHGRACTKVRMILEDTTGWLWWWLISRWHLLHCRLDHVRRMLLLRLGLTLIRHCG